MKSVFMILFVTINTISSQLILKYGLSKLAKPAAVQGNIQFIIHAACSPYVICALFLQGIGYVVWMFVVNSVKLGVAFAISGSLFYILMAFAAWVFYDERLSGVQWVGLLLITIGVICMASNMN